MQRLFVSRALSAVSFLLDHQEQWLHLKAIWHVGAMLTLAGQ